MRISAATKKPAPGSKPVRGMRSRTAAVLAAVRKHGSTKTYDEIAAMLGTTLYRIASLAARYGIKKPYVAGKLRAKQRLQHRPDNATILATIKAHATTKSRREIAALLGVSLCCICYVMRRAGFKKPLVQSKRLATLAHQREIVLAHGSTHSLVELGRMLGVCRQRAWQICNRWRVKRKKYVYSKFGWMSSRQLRKLARQPDKSLAAIAAEAGATGTALAKELHRRGIEPFTKRERNARLLKKGMGFCSLCRRAKPFDQFRRGDSRSSRLDNRCLECRRVCAAQWRKRRLK